MRHARCMTLLGVQLARNRRGLKSYFVLFSFAVALPGSQNELVVNSCPRAATIIRMASVSRCSCCATTDYHYTLHTIQQFLVQDEHSWCSTAATREIAMVGASKKNEFSSMTRRNKNTPVDANQRARYWNVTGNLGQDRRPWLHCSIARGAAWWYHSARRKHCRTTSRIAPPVRTSPLA